MKPLPPFEVNIQNAKKYVEAAIDYLFSHKDDPDMSLSDYEELSLELDGALGWLDSAKTYYSLAIKEHKNETDGH